MLISASFKYTGTVKMFGEGPRIFERVRAQETDTTLFDLLTGYETQEIYQTKLWEQQESLTIFVDKTPSLFSD